MGRLASAFAEVVSPGAQTTVQDGGRPGYLAKGIPPAGAQDHFAHRVAHLLVGNEVPPPPLTLGSPGDAGLECLLTGPKLRFTHDAVVAVTGGEFELSIDGDPAPMWATVEVPAGAVLSIGRAKAGLRAYLAVAGGIDVPLYLGSRSTYVRGAIGGLEGRALRKDDRLPIGTTRSVVAPRRFPEALVPALGDTYTCRAVRGPQDALFTDEGIETFFSADWIISPASDRMGFRFRGPELSLLPKPGYLLEHAGSGPADIVDDVTPLGGIQIAGGVEPIVMGVEVPSTGGFAKIGTVITADLGVLGQMRPGDSLRFVPVSLDEALSIAREQSGRIDERHLQETAESG